MATLIEKILRRNTGKTDAKPGDIVTAKVDRVMVHDIFIPFVAEKFEEMGFTKLWDPDKVVLIYDHLVPASQVDDTRHFHKGDEFAKVVLNMYCNRIADYIGKYYLELEGKVDTIVFTAGVGENGPIERAMVAKRLRPLGVILDEEKNNHIASYKEKQQGEITTEDSKIKIEVIPTNEEIMIVRDTYDFVK